MASPEQDQELAASARCFDPNADDNIQPRASSASPPHYLELYKTAELYLLENGSLIKTDVLTTFIDFSYIGSKLHETFSYSIRDLKCDELFDWIMRGEMGSFITEVHCSNDTVYSWDISTQGGLRILLKRLLETCGDHKSCMISSLIGRFDRVLTYRHRGPGHLQILASLDQPNTQVSDDLEGEMINCSPHHSPEPSPLPEASDDEIQILGERPSNPGPTQPSYVANRGDLIDLSYASSDSVDIDMDEDDRLLVSGPILNDDSYIDLTRSEDVDIAVAGLTLGGTEDDWILASDFFRHPTGMVGPDQGKRLFGTKQALRPGQLHAVFHFLEATYHEGRLGSINYLDTGLGKTRVGMGIVAVQCMYYQADAAAVPIRAL